MGDRRKLAEDLVAELMFAADCACCICHARGRIQIHHIDGDPGCDDPEDLAPLCLACHDAVSTTGGQGRRLGPELVRKYRDDWVETVRLRRERERTSDAGQRAVAPADVNQILETLAVLEVRKVAYTIPGVPRRWDGVAEHIRVLAPYARDFGSIVRSEVLSAVYPLACYTRAGMPLDVAHAVSVVLEEAMHLPLFLDAKAGAWRPGPEQVELLARIADIGGSIAYDAAKYVRDIKIVDVGGDVTATCLRYAHHGGVVQLRKACMSIFDRAIRGAEDAAYRDGKEWLIFLRDDSLSDPDGSPIPLPALEGPAP